MVAAPVIAPSVPPDAAPMAAPVPPPTAPPIAAPAPAPIRPPRQPHAGRDRTGWYRPTNQAPTPARSRSTQEMPSSCPQPFSKEADLADTTRLGRFLEFECGNTWRGPSTALRLRWRTVLRVRRLKGPQNQDRCSVARPPGRERCAGSLDLGPPLNRDHGPPSRSVRAPI